MKNYKLVHTRTFYQRYKNSADHSAQFTVHKFHDADAGDAYWRLFNATRTYDEVFAGYGAEPLLNSVTFALQYGK